MLQTTIILNLIIIYRDIEVKNSLSLIQLICQDGGINSR